MAAESPLIAKVLQRYPDVARGSLTFPADAAEWTEKDIDLFVGSGGFLKPKKKKAAAATAVARAPAQAAPTVAAEVAPTPVAGTVPKTGVETARETAAPAVAEPAAELTPAAGAPAKAVGEPLQLVDNPCVEPPPVAAVVSEIPLTIRHRGEYWAPYTVYMEDVGERGLKLVSALNKCERFRSVGLLKSADLTLNELQERFGAGVLLREFALEVTAPPPKDILSCLWVSLRVELPCAPFLPMSQTVLADGSNVPVCKAAFGMLMLDTSTMSILQDKAIYEKVAEPLRKAFGLSKPTGNEGVPKFPRLYPSRGTPFQPTRLSMTSYTVMLSDCDMYRVIFHPQMVVVCEKVNFAVGAAFRQEPAVAIYANLSKPARVGDVFDVRVFSQTSGEQVRVLYLFTVPRGTKGAGATAASRCTMAAFVVYGSPPGRLFVEDVSACAATKFGALEDFASGGKAPPPEKVLDLSTCSRA